MSQTNHDFGYKIDKRALLLLFGHSHTVLIPLARTSQVTKMGKVNAVKIGKLLAFNAEIVKELMKDPEWDARLLQCKNMGEAQNLISEYVKAKGLRLLDLSKDERARAHSKVEITT